jgi:hypothetical protein
MGGANAQATASTTTMTKVAGPYTLKLIIGSAESMSMHGNASERMIGGKNATCDMSMHMAMLAARAGKSKMQTCNHHVEVHVHTRKTGKIVTNAKVAISLQGQGMHGSTMMITVPIMAMEGMKAGPSDFHYGNNIYAAPGKYAVHVTVNGVKANFSVSLSGAM